MQSPQEVGAFRLPEEVAGLCYLHSITNRESSWSAPFLRFQDHFKGWMTARALLKNTVDNKIILDYLNQTKFSIVSDETFFSFFMLDCISKNVGIFYNKKDYTFDKKLINLVAKVHQINFGNFEESLSNINDILNKTQEIPNYKFENFKDYYSDYFLKI